MGARNAIKRLFSDKEIAKTVTTKYLRARLEINKKIPLKVENEKEFLQLITGVVQFFESKTGETVSNDELALQKAELILSRFGDVGIAAAKDAAIKSTDGGTMEIVQTIFLTLKASSEEAMFETILRQEVDELDELQKLAFVKEYIEYKGLSLPESARKMRPEELVSRYKEIIKRDLQIAETITKTLGL